MLPVIGLGEMLPGHASVMSQMVHADGDLTAWSLRGRVDPVDRVVLDRPDDKTDRRDGRALDSDIQTSALNTGHAWIVTVWINVPTDNQIEDCLLVGRP